MRLDQTYIRIIKKTIFGKLEDASIFLFGSRVDDSKKGGDIDLFVRTSKPMTMHDELELLTALEQKGIHRKIDLIIDSPQNSKSDFFQKIKNQAIAL